MMNNDIMRQDETKHQMGQGVTMMLLWNRAKGTVWLIALVPIIDRTESIPLSLGLVAQCRAEQNMGLQVRRGST